MEFRELLRGLILGPFGAVGPWLLGKIWGLGVVLARLIGFPRPPSYTLAWDIGDRGLVGLVCPSLSVGTARDPLDEGS